MILLIVEKQIHVVEPVKTKGGESKQRTNMQTVESCSTP
jgi:hypothetical protein